MARCRPASKCSLRADAANDVVYRKEFNVAMPIVAEQYVFVIGVDTHAATHSLVQVSAGAGGIVDEAVFPNSPGGLDRALAWITRGVDNQPALVLVEGAGSYGAGLAERVNNSGLRVAEPAAMPAAQRRSVGKADALDAARIARSVLAVDITRLRRPRADGQWVALRVLTVAREEMVAERTRAINALTALLRPSTSVWIYVKRCHTVNSKSSPSGVIAKKIQWSPPAERERSGWPVASWPSTANLPTTARVSIPWSRMWLPSCASYPVWDRSSPRVY